MKTLISAAFIFFVLISVSSANGQTREEFEKRYGAPIAQSEDVLEFYIREDIILKITYDEKNVVKEFLVFPNDVSKSIKSEIADEIKEELVPSENRIGESWGLSFNTGGGGINGETYRNVRILTQGSVYRHGIVKITIEFGKFPAGVKLVTEEDL